MPTNHDETLQERYARELAAMEPKTPMAHIMAQSWKEDSSPPTWQQIQQACAEHDALKAENALLEEVNAQLREQNDAVGKACAKYEAELERIKALPPVAWMYDRAGSAFNPQFLPAGPNADQRRNGIVSEGVVILNPDSACRNWQPLIALGSKTDE